MVNSIFSAWSGSIVEIFTSLPEILGIFLLYAVARLFRYTIFGKE